MPIPYRFTKTVHSSDVIRILVRVNLSGENFPSSLVVKVWEKEKGREVYAGHKWEIVGGKGRFTRRGFGSFVEEHTRKICEEVYFNGDITELHFPKGIVRLKQALVK